jgi:CRISPR-associated protein Csm2
MDVKQLIVNDPSGAELVDFSKATAEALVREQLTRSQIRNIFTEVRKIEALWEARPEDARRRLNMLKPKLDYQTVRAEPVKRLRDVLSEAITAVEQAPDDRERQKRFAKFMDLFEAILAYHRAYGGRN